jgi:folylpolyglutamate synthase/dihydropteroate synthase
VEDLFPGGQVVLICGILKTKDSAGMVRRIAAVTQQAIITVPSPDKGAPPEELLKHFEQAHVPAQVLKDMEQAFAQGLALAREASLPLVICGSLYLVGTARSWFLNKN